MPVLLIVVLLPVVELWLMIEIGSRVGVLAVIGWLVLMVVLGMNLLRYLGAANMLRSAQQLRAAAQPPAQLLADNLFKALGAVLLIIPGFLSDAVALLCFIPLLRRLFVKRFMAKMATKVSAAGFYSTSFGAHTTGTDPFGRGKVYEHQGSTKVDDPAARPPLDAPARPDRRDPD